MNKLAHYISAGLLISSPVAVKAALPGVSVNPAGDTIISCVQSTKSNPMLLARMQGDAFLLQERDGIQIRHEERQRMSMNKDHAVAENYDSVTHLNTEGTIQTKQINQWQDNGLICLELKIVSHL